MKNRKMLKLVSAVTAFAILTTMSLSACGQPSTPTAQTDTKATTAEATKADATKADAAKTDAKPVTIKWASFSNEQMLAFEKLNLIEAYKKVKPNVTIEIEKFKDSTDFENAFKIRKAANELPDLFQLKPYQLTQYKDVLLPLNDTDVAKNNTYADVYKVDDKVLGVPECSFNEFVYYSKSIYKEYNLSVPKTWQQFVDNAKKINDGGKYIPILLGQKDDWVNYPFTEFMAAEMTGDGFFWNTIAGQDEPFAKGQPFYNAFSKFKMLSDAKVFGKDPLGAGFDQVKTMLYAKKGAMMVSGAWYLAQVKDDAKKANGDLSDIGTFFLPVRDSESEAFNTITMVDGFTSTPKDGKNVEACKEFMSWYFSKDWYQPYMTERGLISTVKGITVDVDPVLAEAYAAQPDAKAVVYDGGGEKFQKLQNATKFSFKKMGQELVAGKDLDKMMDDMNKSWKAARASVK